MSRLLSHYFSSTISFRTLSFFILWPPSCYIPYYWLLNIQNVACSRKVQPSSQYHREILYLSTHSLDLSTCWYIDGKSNQNWKSFMSKLPSRRKENGYIFSLQVLFLWSDNRPARYVKMTFLGKRKKENRFISVWHIHSSPLKWLKGALNTFLHLFLQSLVHMTLLPWQRAIHLNCLNLILPVWNNLNDWN